VVDQGKLLQLDASRSGVDTRPLGSYDLRAASPNAMVYDDTNDELTLLFADKRRTLTLSKDLKHPRELALPAGVEVRATALMTNTSLDDSIWLGHTDSNLVHQLRPSERGWQVVQVCPYATCRQWGGELPDSIRDVSTEGRVTRSVRTGRIARGQLGCSDGTRGLPPVPAAR
jgi:hypothetical protein